MNTTPPESLTEKATREIEEIATLWRANRRTFWVLLTLSVIALLAGVAYLLKPTNKLVVEIPPPPPLNNSQTSASDINKTIRQENQPPAQQKTDSASTSTNAPCSPIFKDVKIGGNIKFDCSNEDKK